MGIETAIAIGVLGAVTAGAGGGATLGTAIGIGAVMGGATMGIQAMSGRNVTKVGGKWDPMDPMSPDPLPEVPTAEGAGVTANELMNRKKAAAASGSESMFTNPLGIAGEANIARKTLLGE